MSTSTNPPSRPHSTSLPGPRSGSGSRHAPASLDASYTGLRRSTQLLISLLQPHSNATPVDILSQADTVLSDITHFDKRLREADPDEVNLDEGRWQDRLDGEGTQVWNQSTIRKYGGTEGDAAGSGEGGGVGLREKDIGAGIVAKLRVIGYRLILLGSVDPNNKEVVCSLLNLTTKAALACLSLPKPDFISASSLLTAGANFARALGLPLRPRPTPSHPSPQTSEHAKALLSHYLARARQATLEQNDSVAFYAMNQIKRDLEQAGALGGREKARLGQTCHELGKAMLVQSREHREEAEAEDDLEKKEQKKEPARKRVESARGWLMWAEALLGDQNFKHVTQLRISTLRLLAQAYLESDPPLMAEGEATLETLLEVDPNSPSLHRRYIRLVMSRDQDNQRIVDAFAKAVKHLPWTEVDGSKLLAELHQLPASRTSAKYPILTALVDGALTRLNGPPDASTEADSTADEAAGPVQFLGRLVMTVMFAVGAGEHHHAIALLDQIDAGFGIKHSLPSNAAFVLATYAWKQGDNAVRTNRHRDAADWFLLAAHSVTRTVQDTVGPKSRRKAALALTHLRDFDKAEAVLNPARGEGPVSARTEFARFNNFARAGRVGEAQGALQRMLGGADFEVAMLFWASDVAREAPEESAKLQGAVLGSLLELQKRGLPDGAEAVDLLTLTRCLIRTTVGRLETASREETVELITVLVDHYKAGHAFAVKQWGQVGLDEDDLLKNVKWLYTSAHGLVAHASGTTDFPMPVTSQLYAAIADLIEMAQQIAPDPTLTARRLMAKFGALGERIRKVREVEPGSPAARAAHGNLLPKLHKLRLDVSSAREEDPSLEGLDELQAALVGMLVEGYGAVGEWDKLESLVANFSDEQPQLGVGVLKACVARALAFEAGEGGAPAETRIYVARLALYQLQSRENVSSSELAKWFRLLIECLDKSGEAYWGDALTTIGLALDYVRQNPAEYGQDEIAWLSSLTWDKGCEYMQLTGDRGQAEGEGEAGSDEAAADGLWQECIRWCEMGAQVAEVGRHEWAGRLRGELEGIKAAYAERIQMISE